MNDRGIVRLRASIFSLRSFDAENVTEGHSAARLAYVEKLGHSDCPPDARTFGFPITQMSSTRHSHLNFEVHSIDVTYVKN